MFFDNNKKMSMMTTNSSREGHSGTRGGGIKQRQQANMVINDYVQEQQRGDSRTRISRPFGGGQKMMATSDCKND